MAKYSLSDYRFTLTLPSMMAAALGLEKLSFGGEGSMIGSIDVVYNEDLFTTKGDATGGYVHEKSLNKTGRITLNINQVAPQLSKIRHICNLYTSGDYDEMSAVITDSAGNSVVIADGVVPSKRADIRYAPNTEDQSWQFNVGVLTEN